MGEMDEVLKEFLAESREGLDQMDRDLLALEKAPGDAERLARVFRVVHTVKGTSGFLALDSLGALTHAGEGLLSRLRDGAVRLTPDVATALLALSDAVRGILARVEATGGEGDADHAALAARLTGLAEAKPTPAAPTPAAPAEAAPADAAPAEATSDGTVRVDVGLLDRLLDLVGELVLARNQLRQAAEARRDQGLIDAAQRLDQITARLQEGVLKTRMQPVGLVARKLPRVVRDTALGCGKRARLDLVGDDTELDRALLEALKGPLTHLVRNAVDHGVEAPEERRRKGKPEEGRLLLTARHEGGQVRLDFSDDGAGIDPERVRRRAVERGLAATEQAALMGNAELLQLVFRPGFSTAERVTSLSGRGVGMDVVKSDVEKVGGTVELWSEPGRGTRVTVRLPLTLSIVPALLVAAGGELFALPQAGLLEVVSLEGGRGVEQAHGAAVYRLRGRLLPLVFLDRLLRLPEGPAAAVVVLQGPGRPFGLVVSAVHDTEEIVVKPLARALRRTGAYAGAAVRGDGRVTLILDPAGLARLGGLTAEGRAAASAAPAAAAPVAAAGQVLVCGVGPERLVALPLPVIERIEELPASSVEQAACGEVVQHRGRIVPLVRLAARPARDAPPLWLVVCSRGGRRVGVAVDRVVDAADAPADVQEVGAAAGVAGSAVIGGRVTDLVDVDAVFRAAGAAALAGEG